METFGFANLVDCRGNGYYVLQDSMDNQSIVDVHLEFDVWIDDLSVLS